MPRSTALLILGFALFLAGLALFLTGASGEVRAGSGADPVDPVRRIGQVAGGLAGIGVAVFALGLVQRLRGR